jgi:hypothetical protein
MKCSTILDCDQLSRPTTAVHNSLPSDWIFPTSSTICGRPLQKTSTGGTNNVRKCGVASQIEQEKPDFLTEFLPVKLVINIFPGLVSPTQRVFQYSWKALCTKMYHLKLAFRSPDLTISATENVRECVALREMH